MRIEWAFGLRTSRFVDESGKAFKHFEELAAAADYSANALLLAQQTKHCALVEMEGCSLRCHVHRPCARLPSLRLLLPPPQPRPCSIPVHNRSNCSQTHGVVPQPRGDDSRWPRRQRATLSFVARHGRRCHMHQLSRQIMRVLSREKGSRRRSLACPRLLSTPLVCHEPRMRGRAI